MEDLIEPYLNNIALILLLLIFIGGVYIVIYIHDIPYEIAKKRNHPHKEAFHAAGWVSLFLMHAIWPILWVWAYWYDENTLQKIVVETPEENNLIKDLKSEVADLKDQLKVATETNLKEN